MAKKTSKKQVREQKQKNKSKKVKKFEKQDIKGISRNYNKKTLHPKIYIILKIISILSYPMVYFIYSPLLILCVIFSIMLLWASKFVENYHNKTFIKKNQIKVLKLDGVLAIILLLITFVYSVSGTSVKKPPTFSVKSEFVTNLENFGSCLTGTRGLFMEIGMKFGIKDIPENMPMPSAPPQGFQKPKEFKMTNLPIEMVFSMTVTSINSVIIVVICVLNGVGLFSYVKKRKKIKNIMNEIIMDNFTAMSDEQYEKIFTYGYVEV